MTDFFLGIIALTLIVAFWGKIKPALISFYNNLIVKPLEFVFHFISVWLSEWAFTGKVIFLSIKQAWNKHKILFILVVAWFLYWMFFVDYSLTNATDWMKENRLGISRYDTFAFIVKYVCGLFGLVGSLFSVLADFEFEKQQYEIKEKNLSKILKNDNLALVIFYIIGMFMYVLYYLFGLKFIIDIYTGALVPFLFLSIFIGIKHKLSKH
jgi:hypothetical protein